MSQGRRCTMRYPVSRSRKSHPKTSLNTELAAVTDALRQGPFLPVQGLHLFRRVLRHEEPAVPRLVQKHVEELQPGA